MKVWFFFQSLLEMNTTSQGQATLRTIYIATLSLAIVSILLLISKREA